MTAMAVTLSLFEDNSLVRDAVAEDATILATIDLAIFAGAEINPGAWILADADGVLVAPRPLA